ncbi:MAG TPA: thioredoxin family protein [Planctomycetota bacterium]|nr:thioredoxin family protein [Planctomycetota bacterium]
MKCPRTHIAALLLSFTPLGAQEPPFATGPLAAAREAAAKASRALVVDFSHDAIAPCRRLRQETWADQALWTQLKPLADVVRVDPEADTAAATEFAIVAYPTLVVLGKDGKELGRVVGFVTAAELATKVVEIIEPLPTDWNSREKLAEDLARKKDLDGASKHYLWLWDEGVQHNPSYTGVRVSFFLSKLAQFARRHPPTLAAMQRRCEAMQDAVAAGTDVRGTLGDLVHLTGALGDTDRLLALYKAVSKEDWEADDYARNLLTGAVAGPLIKQGRFAEILELVPDPLARLEDGLKLIRDVAIPEQVRTVVVRQALQQAKQVLTALFAVKDARSAALVDRMLEIDESRSTWLLVLNAAKDSGNDVACHDHAVRALQTLPEADHDRVREFLKKR